MATATTGKVFRIFPSEDRTRIILINPKPENSIPNSGGYSYFSLLKSHDNYAALYSLALTAATNRLNLSIRIVGNNIAAATDPEISYMYIDWD
jgi:hypothetical protein